MINWAWRRKQWAFLSPFSLRLTSFILIFIIKSIIRRTREVVHFLLRTQKNSWNSCLPKKHSFIVWFTSWRQGIFVKVVDRRNFMWKLSQRKERKVMNELVWRIFVKVKNTAWNVREEILKFGNSKDFYKRWKTSNFLNFLWKRE